MTIFASRVHDHLRGFHSELGQLLDEIEEETKAKNTDA